MSGHSKWAKIHRKKGVADAKKGAIFTKLGNLITIAAKQGGGSMETNFKLRLAVDKAKSANMPKDKIQKAIDRGTGADTDASALTEAVYEVFGPAGSTFIVETITDNTNRTLTDLKTTLSKNGGTMGGLNTVMWQYNKVGQIIIDISSHLNKDQDELELKIIDAGATDIIKEANEWEIITPADKLQEVENKITATGLSVKESGQIYKAKEELNITDQTNKEKIEKLYEAMDELDDVNEIYTNLM